MRWIEGKVALAGTMNPKLGSFLTRDSLFAKKWKEGRTARVEVRNDGSKPMEERIPGCTAA